MHDQGSGSGTLGALLDARLPSGLGVQWPGGKAGATKPSVLLKLSHRRLLSHLLLGRMGQLGEAYVCGELQIDGSLTDLMASVAALAGDPVQRGRRAPWLAGLARLQSRWLHRPERDARHVRFHYDICDAFHALWLDPLRVYSCAYFATPDATLAEAQQAKLDMVCRKLQLAPGQRFLDIGAGWGGLLIWAAQHYGVRALGITLSQNQHTHINRLIDSLGLRGQAEVQLLDYRALRGTAEFDRIASVGMFEHVGKAHIERYFGTLNRLLRPGGLLLNHAIAAGGMNNPQLGAGLGDFIDKHVFPGGELVHVTRAVEGLSRAGLELLDAESLRPHYARTLWAWSDNLDQRLDEARGMVGDATLRAYRLYLAGSALCFERGWLSLYQLLAAKPDGQAPSERRWAARSDYPFTRRHMSA